MTREQMVAPFAEEELRTFEKTWKDKGGRERSISLTYIEDETVMDRLDVGYGPGNWQIQVDPVGENVVKVRLGVRDGTGGWVWFEDFGYPNRTDGETLKEAVSDGIRRCGRFVGIARDLYRKSTYEPAGSLARNGAPAKQDAQPPIEQAPDGGLIGTASVGKGDADFNLRQTPDGHALTFRLVSGRKGVKVTAFSPLAEMLAGSRDKILGSRVTAWGTVSEESFDKVTDGKTTTIAYPVMELARLKGPAFDYAMPDEPEEAESVPLFDEDEQAAIDKALAS